MAEPDVGADTPLSPQLFDGGVHVKGAPGDDSVRDEVQTEDLVGLLISLTALDLALVSEEQEAPEGVEGLSFVQLAVDPTTVVGPAGLFKQDVAFRDRTGPRKRNLLRASRLGRIDKVRPIRQNMPIW